MKNENDSLDYVKKLGIIYERLMAIRKNDEYAINQIQLEKFANIVGFFFDIAKESNGNVDEVDMEPKECHGGVTATFIVFDVFGENIHRMCKVLDGASALTIDAMDDGKVCISVTVPNVFIHK